MRNGGFAPVRRRRLLRGREARRESARIVAPCRHEAYNRELLTLTCVRALSVMHNAVMAPIGGELLDLRRKSRDEAADEAPLCAVARKRDA